MSHRPHGPNALDDEEECREQVDGMADAVFTALRHYHERHPMSAREFKYSSAAALNKVEWHFINDIALNDFDQRRADSFCAALVAALDAARGQSRRAVH
jgi:hypothetical protein